MVLTHTRASSLKSRCSTAFVSSPLPRSRCALLKSKAEAHSTKGRSRDSSWTKQSQKQPGGQTESSLKGKSGSTLSGSTGVACGSSPVRASLVSPFVVSFMHSSAAFAKSQFLSSFGISLPLLKHRQQTRFGFF